MWGYSSELKYLTKENLSMINSVGMVANTYDNIVRDCKGLTSNESAIYNTIFLNCTFENLPTTFHNCKFDNCTFKVKDGNSFINCKIKDCSFYGNKEYEDTYIMFEFCNLSYLQFRNISFKTLVFNLCEISEDDLDMFDNCKYMFVRVERSLISQGILDLFVKGLESKNASLYEVLQEYGTSSSIEFNDCFVIEEESLSTKDSNNIYINNCNLI